MNLRSHHFLTDESLFLGFSPISPSVLPRPAWIGAPLLCGVPVIVQRATTLSPSEITSSTASFIWETRHGPGWPRPRKLRETSRIEDPDSPFFQAMRKISMLHHSNDYAIYEQHSLAAVPEGPWHSPPLLLGAEWLLSRD